MPSRRKGDGMNIHFIIMLGFFATVGVAVIAVVMVKCSFLKSFFFSVVSGIGALLIIHFTSLMSGISLPIHLYSLLTAALGGLPAVAGMLVMRLF